VTTLEPELQAAFDVVIDDVRQGEPISRTEALYQVWQTSTVDELNDDDPTYDSYVATLVQLTRSPSRAELLRLVGQLAGEGSIHLTDLEEFWAYRATRGELS
jgi:hypothetical protein